MLDIKSGSGQQKLVPLPVVSKPTENTLKAPASLDKTAQLTDRVVKECLLGDFSTANGRAMHNLPIHQQTNNKD